MKNFVAVRTEYSKRPKALPKLDHAYAHRNGFTNSVNVISSLSHNNFGCYRHNATSCSEAFLIVELMHQTAIKKRVRSDFNALFEHVLIFSEPLYAHLERVNGSERVKNAFTHLLERYADQIKHEFGFEPLGFDMHLDEGFEDPLSGKVRRNIHFHVQFYNYDFKKGVAPLRHLMTRGLGIDGKTNQLNPHFSRFQDIAAEVFQKIGFRRGISKNVTGRDHLRKEVFVLQKLQHNQLALKATEEENKKLEMELQQRKTELEQLKTFIGLARQIRDKLIEDINELNSALKSVIAATKHEARRLLNSLMPKITAVEERQRKNSNNWHNKTK
ncbi:MAG TPA: hypothetical protein DF774_11420 [Rheinheimera sp.]|uniref:hypothetical protein n=1 Tax=Rheinheimera sp. TaxID=1869214 RepID=UPI000ECCC65A|nr:hypothetical protein [Rheinheimera sp.]HCU66356.1 hypothetical protein [Rheinheimera sp.]